MRPVDGWQQDTGGDFAVCNRDRFSRLDARNPVDQHLLDGWFGRLCICRGAQQQDQAGRQPQADMQ